MAPGRADASSCEMKMCSISVAPMPSISVRRVASNQASRVDVDSASPADTHLRSFVARSAGACGSIAR